MQRFKTKELAFIALFVALNIVSAYLIIPVPGIPSPVALQPLIINLVGMLLFPRQAIMVYIVYWILGLIGLPVFTGGQAGPGKLFGPTGGYIIGFGVAAWVIAMTKGKQYNFFRYNAVGICLGMPIVYGLGMVQLKLLTSLTWTQTFVVGVLPFLPLDLVKCVLAAYIAKPLHKIFLRNSI